ncbi:MAG: class I SAM-dependent methyltransferase [Planctomycetes bacterium]|nr:class I SAM-dependent methyltransferase [Planctomycetota bacterium]MBU4400297.1 class I SAM-dependent methyltransferase [Planctomycetota bacterium]MCG2685688.1 class I SAM-dependent methyltransferase [Planctomycetales bacterium]
MLNFLSPRPMRHEQFQLHAEVEDRHWWFVGRRRILCRLVEEVLPPDRQATIVDVGCGTGGNIAALADRYRCVGIDTSAEAVELARRRFSQVQFVAGHAPQKLGELAQEARLVLLTDVLEHVADDYAMFSELFASASPGCCFLVTVPADQSLWSEHDESFGHYRRYDLQRLAGVWEGLPATTLLISYFNSRLLPAVRLARAWNRRRGRAAGRAGTDFRLPSRPINSLLTAIFAGEARRLLAAMHGRKRGYRAGVSLMALVRREAGPAVVRSKPAGLLPDRR